MAYGPPTITQERSGWNAVSGHPPMRRRDQWGSRRSYTDERTITHPATRVFIHISITNPENYSSYDAHARALEAIGISRFPNTGVSYNRGFMAGSSNVYELQPMGRRGAHTVNDFQRSTCSTSGCPGRGSSLTAPSYNLNYNARAYVWCANVQHSVPDAVVELIARAIYTDYRAGFITKAAAQNIHGHRCVSSKSCPGDRMWARMGEIQALVNKLIAGTVPPAPQEDELPTVDEVWNYRISGGPQDGDAVVAALAEAATFSLDARNNSAETRTQGAQILSNQAKVLSELAAIRAALGADPVDEAALAAQVAALLLPNVQETIRAVLADVDEVDENAIAAQVVAQIGAALATDAPA